ncbi:MAG TPA: 30S ribosomal protein S7 [Deltaproteobacteria bacterium]|nr:30S ribosomal protein S7 [Deltaproteobacteria bacterium]
MPRRREVPKRRVLPDPKFHEVLVTKFTNCLMRDGKKSTAERIVYGSFEVIHERTREDPLMVFRRALDNVKPVVEVKSRRVGGSTYQVPVEVRPERQTALALRWLIDHARKRSGKSMREKLANELIEASHNRGGAIKRKEDVHRMAEANKAFAHYRW